MKALYKAHGYKSIDVYFYVGTDEDCYALADKAVDVADFSTPWEVEDIKELKQRDDIYERDCEEILFATGEEPTTTSEWREQFDEVMSRLASARAAAACEKRQLKLPGFMATKP